MPQPPQDGGLAGAVRRVRSGKAARGTLSQGSSKVKEDTGFASGGAQFKRGGPYASKDPLVSFNNLSGHFLLVSLTLTLNNILGEYL